VGYNIAMFVSSRVTGATHLGRSWEFPVHFAKVTLKTRPSDDVDGDGKGDDDDDAADDDDHDLLKENYI